jgi:hypothetical protein
MPPTAWSRYPVRVRLSKRSQPDSECLSHQSFAENKVKDTSASSFGKGASTAQGRNLNVTLHTPVLAASLVVAKGLSDGRYTCLN